MKNFIFKTVLFLLPFIVLQLFVLYGYNTKNGDLVRIGNVYEMYPNYRLALVNELEGLTNFKTIDDLNLRNEKIKYLLIGDSFTDDKSGYKNFLGYLSKEPVSNIHYDLSIDNNPFQTLAALTKTDFFKNNDIEYVVLESVERYLAYRVHGFDSSKVIKKFSVEPIFYSDHDDYQLQLTDKEFPNKTIFTVPYNTFRYFKGDTKFSKVYRYMTKRNLFAVDKKEVFFYHEDLDLLPHNNWPDAISKLEVILNDLSDELSKQNVKLVFLPAPNKMTAYYDDIVGSDKLEKPIILSEIEKFPKKYIYVNPMKRIEEFKRNNKKDFYFYDDTHWGFPGSKAVAEQLILETK